MIAENLQRIVSTLHPGVRLVAVSKFHSVAEMMEAYAAGQRCFGENRPQEFAAKVPQMPSDVEWHFIGHLQTNKLGKVLPYAAMVESVDSLHLLEAVNAWCLAHGKVMPVLLELHLGAEQTKGGFPEAGIRAVLDRPGDFPGVRFCGLMGMATNTSDEAVVRADFRRIALLFRSLREAHPDLKDFRELSIGMSGDYPVAMEEGSTLVRVGTAIFGERL